MGYSGRNVLMAMGDSIGDGSFSTSALASSGIRFLISAAALAANVAVQWVGSQFNGTMSNPQTETYPGQDLLNIQVNSRVGRVALHPEGILHQGGTNTIGAGNTAAQTATAYTNSLNEVIDRASHYYPGGGSTLRFILCAALLHRSDSGGAFNSIIDDFNTNFLPGIVSTAATASGLDIAIVPTTGVTDFFGDGIHLTDLGFNQWFTNGWWPKLLPRLRPAT